MGTTSGISILLADDEPWYMEGVKDALEAEGYEVILESPMTGTNVLEILREPKRRVDILILDIMMDPGPELANEVPSATDTGIIVCRKIRKEIKPDIPIICLTVVGDDSVLDQMSGMGCAILRKSEASISDILSAVKDAEHMIRRI